MSTSAIQLAAFQAARKLTLGFRVRPIVDRTCCVNPIYPMFTEETIENSAGDASYFVLRRDFARSFASVGKLI
jgi:hypothetical protein